MKKKNRREVDLVVISDVHLGTYGCRAKELLQYMKSIQPKHVILNGDIVDIWQFKKSYFPKAHIKVIRQIMSWIGDGVKVDYITGNHDEMLRKFAGFELGSFRICNKVLMQVNNHKTAWFFHGDVFDVTMKYSKWLAKLGAIGYDTLIMINIFVNWCSEKVGKGRISLSKKIKNSVKSAVKFIDDFEQVAADIAIQNEYDYVICGHIHQPQMREIENEKGKVTYLNSGDWIENLSALEFHNGAWSMFKFEEHFDDQEKNDEQEDDIELETNQLFEKLITEFNLMRA